MDSEPRFDWTWKHWIALAVSAGLWVALWYGAGALMYWLFFVLR